MILALRSGRVGGRNTVVGGGVAAAVGVSWVVDVGVGVRVAVIATAGIGV
ncbi:MAG: hypothetical protein O7F09_04780 [Chloroflexi bacterium]|nr:hypothetical protein [Chloroflexota bacterium]